MKKLIALILALLCLTTCVFPVAATARPAVGTEVLASEVTLIKTGLLGKKLTFNDTDFKQALLLADFDGVTVLTLPSSAEGTLMLGGRRVREGQSIKRKNLHALSFVPATDKVTESKFLFTVNGQLAGASIACVMKFTDKINYAPSIEETQASLSVWTQEGLSYHGKMCAVDPEGEALEYIVIRYPKAGLLTVKDSTAGTYRYTPAESFRGEDSFTFVARDPYGNYTAPATVTVTVDRRMGSALYVDMEDRAAYNEAVVMEAAGIMSGVQIGDDMYFRPEQTVTRAEFVAMALKAAGIRKDTSLTETFFDDNGQIPPSLLSYVATAQRLGIVHGAFDGKQLNFRPSDPITRCEAAVVLSHLVPGDGTEEAPVFADIDTVPVWARPAVGLCASLGILTGEDGTFGTEEAMTREQTAVALYRMMQVK